MTDTQLTIIATALATGLPALVVSIATLVTSIRNSRKSDEIKVLADGTLTAIRAELSIEKERVAGLERLTVSQATAQIPGLPGPQGEPGPQGKPGPQGPKGKGLIG